MYREYAKLKIIGSSAEMNTHKGMDENLKKQFDVLCSDFGMTASTAINVFARAVVRERKIPFEITSPETEVTREKAMQAFLELRAKAKETGVQDMTLDEINEEIRLTR